MRLALDTNIVLWGRTSGQLLDAAAQQLIELASGTALLAKLQSVFTRPKFAHQLTKRRLTVPRVVERDPNDNHVIAWALAAGFDAIDRHLLDLDEHQVIPILSTADALKRLA